MSFDGTPRFDIVRQLGRGGMGAVYEAFDRERQSEVALKVLTLRDPDALLRFKREFRALQHVVHPNLVALGELMEVGGRWFFSMELVRGVDLLTHVRTDLGPVDDKPTMPRKRAARPVSEMRREPEFDEARLRAAFHQLALGLSALHRAGHLHRDIKPSNVLVTPENRVVLLDFGLIRTDAERSAESSPDAVFGTPEYMAPEQAAGRGLTPATDWYAVGAMLFEALTGETPFSGHPLQVMLKKQTHAPPSPSSLLPDLPPDLDALCRALLEPYPERRPTEAEILGRFYVELRRDDRTYLALPLSPRAELFTGRGLELDRLERALTEASAGRARTVFITGDWGMGKTALVRELTRRWSAKKPAPLLLTGRCFPRETIPFKTVDMLFDDVSRVLSAQPESLVQTLLPPDVDLLARTFPVLERVNAIASLPLRSFDALDPAERRGRLFAAARELFRRLARVQPLVLVVEDLQWADADGLKLLHEILAPPAEVPLLFVGTLRTESPSLSGPSLLVDGLDASTVETVHLDRLTDADAVTLAAAYAAPERAAAIARQANGHPVLIRELSLAPSGRPASVEEALKSRIEQLPAEVRGLLDVIVLAAVPPPQAIAAQAAGLAWPEAERGMMLLRAAQLVRTVGSRRTDLVEVAHAKVRDAVLSSQVPPLTKRLHAQLAEPLRGWHRPLPQAIAEHWAGAGDPARAKAALLDGGERALAALAFGQAARLFSAAAQLATGEERATLEARSQRAAQLSHT